MTTTHDLLGVIAALRQRLEQAQHLAGDADSVATAVLNRAGAEALAGLRQRVDAGCQDTQLMHQALRQAGSTTTMASELPPHLTNRANRLLQQNRELLNWLKKFAIEPLLQDENHPVAVYYQNSVLLADLVLRALQTLPETPAVQLRHCSGIEVLMAVVRQRTGLLEEIVGRHRRDEEQVRELTTLLRRLHDGTPTDPGALFALAETLIREASEGQPLALPAPEWTAPPRGIAVHGLLTARVMARIAVADAHWHNNLLQAVVAALVHDVGMLAVPAEIQARSEALDMDQRAELERHCRTGANLLEQLSEDHPWLVEVARNHHERLDGTGYPVGLRDVQIEPLVRLVSVCDVYAALCSPRPHRPALDTRDALKEMLTQAHRGLLDRNYVHLLLRLSYYPAGTAVELNDGARGVVVAGEEITGDEARPSCPVVAVLTDAEGEPLPQPQLLDLARCDGRHVQRSLSAAERSESFGSCYPQYLVP